MMAGASWRDALDRSMGIDSVTPPSTPPRVTPVVFRVFLPLIVLGGLLWLSIQADADIQQRHDSIIDGPQTSESLELWKHLERDTPTDAVFVFRKPFVLSLYANRRSHVIIPVELEGDIQRVEQAYRDSGVTYFVFDIVNGTGKIEGWLNIFLDTTDNIKEVWRNSRYIIYGWRQ